MNYNDYLELGGNTYLGFFIDYSQTCHHEYFIPAKLLQPHNC